MKNQSAKRIGLCVLMLLGCASLLMAVSAAPTGASERRITRMRDLVDKYGRY